MQMKLFISGILTLCLLVLFADMLNVNGLDLNQDRQNIEPDLDANSLTPEIFFLKF